jgi:DNA-binding SARP family transcriptional activator
MELRVLGPLEVVTRDEPARVTGRKERAVLASLIVHLGRACSAEELVAAVWGADAPPTAEKSLQVRLSHLRSALGAGRGLIVRDGRGYRLAVESESVDAARFERLVDEASRRPPAEALDLYDEALGLVRGRPYADVEEFDGLAAEVRRLDELRLRATEGRLRALLDLGRHAQVLPELERLTADEPHHEGFAALQMLALYRAGRQVEALEAYRETARRLTELGLDPSEDLRRLERLILEQDEQVAAPERIDSDAPRTNLPARLASFLGREEELDALADRIANHRLVTVAGAGGVGKTSVAVEAIRGQVQRLRDGAWLVELAPVTTPEDLPAAIAGALPFGSAGPDIAGGGQQAASALAQRLSGREMLLLLDGCEHLTEAVASLARRILAASPGVRIVATSRQPLGVLGEALLELRPLDPAEPAAIRLFADRARAADPTFSLDDGETAAAVEQICRRLDGLPLALELAAARVRALPVPEIAAQLAGGFTLQPLDEMVAWSFGLLSPSEQELFARLSLFRSPFTLADAQRVGGAHAADALAASSTARWSPRRGAATACSRPCGRSGRGAWRRAGRPTPPRLATSRGQRRLRWCTATGSGPTGSSASSGRWARGAPTSPRRATSHARAATRRRRCGSRRPSRRSRSASVTPLTGASGSPARCRSRAATTAPGWPR